ncbi:nuclear transport factor 2 family protein [Nostoc sp. UCD121]|uniref:nuclear transport factor 2 family protein n=1 Tax=unclassified Nostoc TaxID=2593658 RepID=UPI001625FBAE|nr:MULTISPECIES: nuclear transport factor 2 family protein [unclassified Nostoc]MBC1219306.1 nuclear transport factor 2 family protein [Nostoc sp. UCD120]MBC1279279.1 nuclear transport factor 2 family protein [Nostoc sp. UCD121]MBC1295761.1 nuclear transport factor 2 family protein [Nostoc sp. UCD122]
MTKDEVLAANAAFYRAFERKDIEIMSTVWSQGTGSFCIHPGSNILRGWKEIRISWEQIFKNTAYIEINTDIIATEILDNIAYVVLRENVFQVVSGRRLEAQSTATNVFHCLGGKWYLVHHHGSPILR